MENDGYKAAVLGILPSTEWLEGYGKLGVEWERYLDVADVDFDVFMIKLAWYPFRSSPK